MSRNLPDKSISLQLNHVVWGPKPLRTSWHFELNTIAFVERLESGSLSSRMMRENITPGLATDESVALLLVEPFFFTVLLFSFLRSPARNSQ